ncbi:uncharacterized protein LOC135926332 [Gordionus sp. m RMFG-2023]|uniref:uncharacterized protein LOC135926332 n=1 Tax=Gordionus sp. m RMFG-2023 TaxID=3053472 RepID=UPI0031FD3B7C
MKRIEIEQEKLLKLPISDVDDPLIIQNAVPQEVNQVLGIMRDNYSKFEKFFDTSDQLKYLNYNSDNYYDSTLSLNRKVWWKKFRVKLVLGLLLSTVLTLLLVPIIIKLRKLEP